MITKVFEQTDILGCSEWWQLSKDYKAIVFEHQEYSDLRLSKKNLQENKDLVRFVYEVLIVDYDFSKDEYTLEETVYGRGVLIFPTKYKMALLQVVEEIIQKNDFFSL